ncbi:alkaline phosphatase family protein [Phenylobacterium sp.]|uniref:alkaline phosphatase family protein n=1 Tax=Phenylobacterium sp. TaxID=1871053 RepID=UPI0035B45AF8
MARYVWASLIWLGVFLASAAGAQAAPPPQPKLVVALVMDQFSLELFERYRPTFTGGLKRLSDGWSFAGYQSHGATETCPGHSTILTGDHPARTGIVANNWYDRATGSNVYCVSVRGVADLTASGSALLRVDTLGDWLNAQKPGSRSFAVSGKDRAAIMMGGHHADAVYWWANGVGFSTSQYAGPATDEVLAPAKAFNDKTFAAWRATPPKLWPAEYPDRCKALETPHTFGRYASAGALPPPMSEGAELTDLNAVEGVFADQLRVSPLFDPLTLAFAEDIVERRKLGRGPGVDLLAVSLSATDHIGHRYGNGGPEMCVHLAVLDAALGRFFDQLDAIGAPYVVVLTADHGAVDAAERLETPAERVDVYRVVGGLSAHLRERFDLAYDPLANNDARQIILNLGPADEPKRQAMIDEALAWLKARPEVAEAYSAEEIAKAAPPVGKPVTDLTMAERFNESYDPERSGDIMVAYQERASLGVPLSPADNVAGHGSPWDHDRRVPIQFWWPGVEAEAGSAPIETVDIAPTLAAMIGVSPPAVDGRCVELGQGCPR